MAKAKIPDMDSLKSDVASFASSLGFSSSSPSGFNDVDFRKSGRLKPLKNREKPQSGQRRNDTQKPETKTNSAKPKPQQPVLSLDDSIDASDRKHKYKNLPALPLVKAGDLSLWYEDALELEKKVFGEECLTSNRVGLRLLEEKRELGDRLMWQYVKEYEISRGRSGDIKMLMASQRSGTAADKVSAFSFIIADNPVANLRSLDSLLGMVTSKVGKRYAFTGFEALKELFISKLLPDRKLKTLLQRPVNKIPETKDGYSLLLFWYWEDSLKPRYERFVLALEEASKDMLPSLKARALKTMYVMLKSKSEQERRLLTGLVNKLGDPQSKNASNADFYLSNLLSDHPNMKVVVIDEVDTFLFRPNLGLRAKYHAVNFLSQIRLSHKGDGPKAAKRLIDIYFALFKVLINEAGKSHQAHTKNEKPDGRNSLSLYSVEKKAKDMEESHVELDSRLLSALLTGVNRAFPYVLSNEADDIIGTQTPMLFKLVHSKNFNVGVQALMLLDKISSKNQIVSDRYYRALYSKLLLPATMNSSKAEMFIGLILRSMKSDVNLKRVCAFSKRLLQVALQQPPQFACGCLFLLSEVLKARPPLWNMVLQKESIDEDLEHFEDVNDDETENQPTTALKIEQNDSGINGVEGANPDSVSSEEEEEADPPAYSDDDVSDDANEVLLRDVTVDASKSHVLSDRNVDKPQASSAIAFLPGGYNPRHREPSFCNADRASWWELMVLATHAHPSVATMAGTILSGANIVYNGNPLIDLSLSAFLDKFMEKKPKQRIWHGSQIEPSQQLDMSHQLIGPEILSLAEMDVQPEDLVFHKFYMNKMSSSKKAKKKKKKTTEEEDAEELYNVDGDDAEDGDDVEGGDESDNEEVENLLDSANLAMEAGGDYDYDDLDKVANEDDYDLVADASDAEIDAPAGIAEGDEFDFASEDDEIDDADEAVDAEDVIDEDDGSNTRKRKRKMQSSKKDPVSPFASLEEYEHLLRDDVPSESKPKRKKGAKKERRNKST